MKEQHLSILPVVEGIQEYAGDEARVLYSDGCHLYKDKIENFCSSNDRIAEVKGICEYSDIVICCMGLDAGLEGEEETRVISTQGGDKPNLNLPGIQEEVLETVAACGKPIVLVLLSGSALTRSTGCSRTYSGNPSMVDIRSTGRQGNCKAAVLVKQVRKASYRLLSINLPEELPEFTDYAMKGRTHRYMEQEALFPFGYGLSSYGFRDQQCEAFRRCSKKEGIRVEADISNVGEAMTAHRPYRFMYLQD